MESCKNCGEAVTPDFVRVFGTGQQVFACPACATVTDLVEGGAAEDDRVTAE